MSSDLFDVGAKVAVIAEELEDEVLEFITQTSAVDLLEVSVVLVREKQVVEVFLLAGLFEGEDALHDNEKDDSDWEHVDILTLVRLALLDFGSHVGHGAAVAIELVDVFVACKTEVGQFEVQLVVNENIFELQVAMDHSAAVHVIDWVEHLVQEKPSSVLTHGAHGLAKVEKKATLDELHNDVDEVVNDAAAGLDDLSWVTILIHVDDARVLKVFKDSDLVVDRENWVLVTPQEFFLEDLDCRVVLSVHFPAQVDLAGVTLA